MNDFRVEHPSTIEFFRDAIFQPAVHLVKATDESDALGIVADLNMVEVAQWAQLGVSIGYLDAAQTIDLLSSSPVILEAWTRRQHIYAKRNVNVIIPASDNEKPTLNVPLFRVRDAELNLREFLQKTFQTILLLTSEDLISAESNYFLDSIGWTDEIEWIARKDGLRRYGSVNYIVIGFSYSFRYMFEIGELVETLLDAPMANNYHPELWLFREDVRTIVQPRFNVERADILKRYFAFAGEMMGSTRTETPEWLDARMTAYRELESTIRRFVTPDDLPDDFGSEQFWGAFLRASEMSHSKETHEQT